jgi:hypothetical protein
MRSNCYNTYWYIIAQVYVIFNVVLKGCENLPPKIKGIKQGELIQYYASEKIFGVIHTQISRLIRGKKCKCSSYTKVYFIRPYYMQEDMPVFYYAFFQCI